LIIFELIIILAIFTMFIIMNKYKYQGLELIIFWISFVYMIFNNIDLIPFPIIFSWLDYKKKYIILLNF